MKQTQQGLWSRCKISRMVGDHNNFFVFCFLLQAAVKYNYTIKKIIVSIHFTAACNKKLIDILESDVILDNLLREAPQNLETIEYSKGGFWLL